MFVDDIQNTNFEKLMEITDLLISQQNNSQSELKTLQNLRKVFVNYQTKNETGKSEDQQPLIEQTMQCAEQYVKLASKKKSTVDSLKRIINYSNTAAQCFICKQQMNEDVTTKMNQNFS